MYGLWRRPDQDIDPIRTALLERVAPALLDLGVPGLRICVEEPEGKAFRVGANPDGSLLAASVSIWIDSYDNRAAARVRPGRGRRADLRLDRRRERVAPPTATTARGPTASSPPACRSRPSSTRRQGLSDDDFYRIWHGEHTPLSFEIHPLWLYVRNQVLRSITPGAPPVRGIVYEAVPTDEHLLDFNLFFGAADEPEQAHRQHPPRQRPHGHLREHGHAPVRPDARVDLPDRVHLRVRHGQRASRPGSGRRVGPLHPPAPARPPCAQADGVAASANRG